MEDNKTDKPSECAAVTPNTEAAILARILKSDESEFAPDVARYLLSIKLPAIDEDGCGLTGCRLGNLTIDLVRDGIKIALQKRGH